MAAGTWHASGSCRMGPASDALTVTDPAGRVHGTQGLRVADASLAPIPPVIPKMMVAERIAEAMAL